MVKSYSLDISSLSNNRASQQEVKGETLWIVLTWSWLLTAMSTVPEQVPGDRWAREDVSWCILMCPSKSVRSTVHLGDYKSPAQKAPLDDTSCSIVFHWRTLVEGLLVTPGVLASESCCHKAPLNRRLKTTDIYFHISRGWTCKITASPGQHPASPLLAPGGSWLSSACSFCLHPRADFYVSVFMIL